MFPKIQNEKDFNRILRKMSHADLVALIIQFFNNNQINENIYPAISLLSKLVLNNSDDKNFAHQFVSNDGLVLY